MTEPVPPSVPAPGLFGRAFGIITSPQKTMAAVVADPRPAVILLLVCVVMALSVALPQFTERGRQAAVDMIMRQAEQRGPVSPEAQARFEQFGRYSPYITLTATFVQLPLASLVIAGLCWVVFNAMLGGTAAFKQVLGVVTHAQVINALGAVLAVPLRLFDTGPMNIAGPFNLAVLAPGLEPGSFLAKFLGSITVFLIWGTVVTGIGLALLYRRQLAGVVTGLLITTAFILAVFASFPVPGR